MIVPCISNKVTKYKKTEHKSSLSLAPNFWSIHNPAIHAGMHALWEKAPADLKVHGYPDKAGITTAIEVRSGFLAQLRKAISTRA